MTPPQAAIDDAIYESRRSPCAKSQRGAAVFWQEPPVLHIYASHNRPPAPFTCDNSGACRRSCRYICLHAEHNAITEALRNRSAIRFENAEILHVKTNFGELVAGGPPSCEQCSRMILDVNLRGMWLLEAQTWTDARDCIHCDKPHLFTNPDDDAEMCPTCGGELAPTTTRLYDGASGIWKFYTALEFHEATLKNRNLHRVTGAELEKRCGHRDDVTYNPTISNGRCNQCGLFGAKVRE